MTLSRVAFLLLIAPLSAQAAISTGGGTDGTGGTGGTGTTTPPPPPTWSKTYSKSALFGSSSWGAGYSMAGVFSATPAHDTYKDQLAASFGLATYAKLDGGYYPLFSVHTAGATEAQRKTTASFNAYVGSAAIYSKSYTSTTSTYTAMNVPAIDWPMTFLDERVSVDLGFVPVTFTVNASGDLNANITGKISNIGIQASTTPSGSASLYASAAVGGEYCGFGECIGASAGVSADVKLVTASAPASGSVTWSLSPFGGAQVNYDVGASLDLHSLDGELDVFAEACLGACISGSKTLISWTGFHATYPLASWSGSACFVGTCSLSNGT